MDGTPDNENPACLFQAHPSKVEGKIAVLLEELKPDIVITHDPTGGYGHPDHLTTYQSTTAAVEAMTEYRPHLYYVCFPKKNFRKLWQEMTDAGITPPFAKEEMEKIGSPEGLIEVDGVVVVGNSRHLDLSDLIGPLILESHRRYGDNVVEFYRRGS